MTTSSSGRVDEITYDLKMNVNKYEVKYAEMLIASHFCADFNWKAEWKSLVLEESF